MRSVYTIIFVFVFSFGYSQIIPHEYIVEVKQDKLDQIMTEISRNNALRSSTHKVISKSLNLILVKGEKDMVDFLDHNNNIITYYNNELTQPRNNPNDPNINLQWDHRLINSFEAWDLTTGGKNAYGDDIVVAVMDSGFFNDHEDIKDNIWKNTAEIPDDNIDNDQNGYIDDYIGLNIATGRGGWKENSHGLGVAGIIGAKGNNGIAITGINWDVKILTVSETLTIAGIIEAYQYAYDLRKKYNDTNGAEGAYIVVTNYSAGTSRRFGSNPTYIKWCAMYDLLGSVGILSCGAAANENFNVDQEGDMPSTCTSDYFIAVTNTDREDKLYESAAYGKIHIDLSAPGTGGYSLDPDDGIGLFGGTSGATPHVAGTIALIHSLDCENITKLSIEEPERHALLLKRSILNSVDPIDDLQTITFSGGRLNLLEAIRDYGSICDGLMVPSDRGPAKILGVTQFGSEFIVDYITLDEDDDYYMMISDALGRHIYHENIKPPEFGKKRKFIEINSLKTGIYFFSIYKTGTINTYKYFYVK